jgi:hypothetical protein
MATLGPHHRNFQESLSTLQFAKRCKAVTLSPIMNSQLNITDGLENPIAAREKIAQLQQELQDCQEQINELYEIKHATE